MFSAGLNYIRYLLEWEINKRPIMCKTSIQHALTSFSDHQSSEKTGTQRVKRTLKLRFIFLFPMQRASNTCHLVCTTPPFSFISSSPNLPTTSSLLQYHCLALVEPDSNAFLYPFLPGATRVESIGEVISQTTIPETASFSVYAQFQGKNSISVTKAQSFTTLSYTRVGSLGLS